MFNCRLHRRIAKAKKDRNLKSAQQQKTNLGSKMDETVPKMVSRNVAIALGIVCIVLVASLAGTIFVLNGANQQNTKRAR
jgi:hypothetical protein